MPRFEHDCDSCIFLGTLELPEIDKDRMRGAYDLYYCPRGGPTVIARYGDDGPDYRSGMEGAENGCFPLNIALAMAQVRKLTQKKGEEDGKENAAF